MKSKIRKEKYLKMIDENVNIIIGDESKLPIDIVTLQNIKSDSPLVEKIVDSGLTAYVYKVVIDNFEYCIKIKRDDILVKNTDGQLSFFNEIITRDLISNHANNPIITKGTTKTLYANFQKGIIVSEWSRGRHVKTYKKPQLLSLFTLCIELMKIGLFEWDLCNGNILFEDNQAVLFDFGYTYPMDIKTEINSEDKDALIFHMVERFETRTFM